MCDEVFVAFTVYTSRCLVLAPRVGGVTRSHNKDDYIPFYFTPRLSQALSNLVLNGFTLGGETIGLRERQVAHRKY